MRKNGTHAFIDNMLICTIISALWKKVWDKSYEFQGTTIQTIHTLKDNKWPFMRAHVLSKKEPQTQAFTDLVRPCQKSCKKSWSLRSSNSNGSNNIHHGIQRNSQNWQHRVSERISISELVGKYISEFVIRLFGYRNYAFRNNSNNSEVKFFLSRLWLLKAKNQLLQ